MSEPDRIVTDPLFVGMTRPPMMMGVTFSFFIINMTATAVLFLATNSFLALLAGLPIHGAGMLACSKEPRIFASEDSSPSSQL